MRIRRKPWARPELAACPFCIDDPENHIGHWHELFPKRQPLHLELGCGKGGAEGGAEPTDQLFGGGHQERHPGTDQAQHRKGV